MAALILPLISNENGAVLRPHSTFQQMQRILDGSSTIRKLETPNENAARSSLTRDSAASPARSSSTDYKSLLSSWRCRFECYHDLPECVEVIHLAK
jgi:hypothetical protein